MAYLHGWSSERLYGIWRGMIRRCDDPKNSNFPNYGGRGITVHPGWHEYPAFKSWAWANGYRDDLTLDRTDNDGSYRPENCRWVPLAENAGKHRSRWRHPNGLKPR